MPPRRERPSDSTRTPHRVPLKKYWHTPGVILLEATAPYSHELVEELHLRRQPQRIDLLLLRRRQDEAQEISHLEALYSRLLDVNLIELKGGTDQVERLDVHTLLSYASQLRISIDKPPRRSAEESPDKRAPYFLNIPPGSSLQLVVIAPSLQPVFREEVRRIDGELAQVSTGIWQGRMAGLPLLFLETERLWSTTQSNRLFYLLTRGVFEAPEGLGELTEREKLVYTEVAEWLIQRQPVSMGGEMRLEKIREYQERQLARQEAWLNSLPPEELLKRLKPEDRVRGLGVEDRVRGLRAEELLHSLPPQEREALARLLNQEK